jgi:hypothetical protein
MNLPDNKKLFKTKHEAKDKKKTQLQSLKEEEEGEEEALEDFESQSRA